MTVASKPKPTAAISITDLPKPEATVETASAPAVFFESREKEPTAFDVACIRPTRNFSNGRLEWEVEASDVARFEQNHFVQMSRVVRKAL